MEKSTRVDEPGIARWTEAVSSGTGSEESGTGIDVFSLSGGVMRPGVRASNRIDGLLSKMIENPESCKYVGDIDKNLDYLFTHLQLDLIAMVASNSPPVQEDKPEEIELPEQVIALDRVRPSV